MKVNNSKWIKKYILSAVRVPKITLPDSVLLQAAWKTLKEGRVPEEVEGTKLPQSTKNKLQSLLNTCHRIQKEGKTTKGAMLRGQRKKRNRPKSKNTKQATLGLKRTRSLLNKIIHWKRKNPIPTILACIREGKSIFGIWEEKKEEGEGSLWNQPYTCNKTTMKALKQLTEKDLEKLLEENPKIIKQCLSPLPKKEKKKVEKLLKKKGTFALDLEEQPYYGKKLTQGEKLIQPVKKGNRKGTVTMVLTRSDKGIRLPIQAHPFPKNATKAEVLTKFHKEASKVKLMLSDGGFYTHEVVRELTEWNTPFLIPANRGSLTTILAAVAALIPPGNTLTIPYNFGGTPIHLHFCVRGPKRGKGGKKEKSEISIFASSEKNPKNIREYGLRWGVENQNRDFKKFLIPTSSTNNRVRRFFLILALHFYALWAIQSLLILIRWCQENNKHLTFWEGQPIEPFKRRLLRHLVEEDA